MDATVEEEHTAEDNKSQEEVNRELANLTLEASDEGQAENESDEKTEAPTEMSYNELEKSRVEFNENIDALMLLQSELKANYLLLRSQITNLMGQGNELLALARYHMGALRVCSAQLPGEGATLVASAKVETVGDMVHLIRTTGNKASPAGADSCANSSGQVDETSANNFIKFFGCLLNQELKDAQRCFQTALECVVELINLKVRLTELTLQIDSLQASGKEVGLL